MDKPERFWKKMFFDWTRKLMLFGYNEENYVWGSQSKVFKPSNSVPDVRRGSGCVMMWVCFSDSGTGALTNCVE